ncbi:MAG TPA: hypothetical protein VF038_07780 [Usitatibacter sp.]|jgi:hypothetical protein
MDRFRIRVSPTSSDREVIDVLRYSTMNSRQSGGLRLLMALLVAGAGLAACDRAPQGQSDAPAATVAPAAPANGAGTAETAKASDEPMKSMNKGEESTSMPRPGQANDHSNLARDPKK